MPTFRKICRWLHRELGFLAVGLTLVYAVSGIAVNHVHDWNANYRRTQHNLQIGPVELESTADVTAVVLERLNLDQNVKNTWRAAPDRLQVFLESSEIDVNLATGEAVRTDFSKRPLLFPLNYMHLNTGRGLWTGVADTYAAVLILVTLTGIFLTRGRRGLAGRGGVLMVLGILLPILYAFLSR